jgi:hypothetical protein
MSRSIFVMECTATQFREFFLRRTQTGTAPNKIWDTLTRLAVEQSLRVMVLPRVWSALAEWYSNKGLKWESYNMHATFAGLMFRHRYICLA